VADVITDLRDLSPTLNNGLLMGRPQSAVNIQTIPELVLFPFPISKTMFYVFTTVTARPR
jgi:hypothetical protein